MAKRILSYIQQKNSTLNSDLKLIKSTSSCLLPCEIEQEDIDLVNSGLLKKLLDDALNSEPSLDWKKQLDDM